jgi:hypothetical protein
MLEWTVLLVEVGGLDAQQRSVRLDLGRSARSAAADSAVIVRSARTATRPVAPSTVATMVRERPSNCASAGSISRRSPSASRPSSTRRAGRPTRRNDSRRTSSAVAPSRPRSHRIADDVRRLDHLRRRPRRQAERVLVVADDVHVRRIGRVGR